MTLVRDRKGRMVAGVCAGVAQYFGLDVTLVRVIRPAAAGPVSRHPQVTRRTLAPARMACGISAT